MHTILRLSFSFLFSFIRSVGRPTAWEESRSAALCSPRALWRRTTTPTGYVAHIASTAHRFFPCGRPPDAGRHNEHSWYHPAVLNRSHRPGVLIMPPGRGSYLV